MGKKEDFDYLEDERKKLWAEVTRHREIAEHHAQILSNLEQHQLLLVEALDKKTSDYEREVKTASAQTTRLKNRAETAAKEAEQSAATVNQLAEQVVSIREQLAEISQLHDDARHQNNEYTRIINELDSKSVQMQTSISAIDERLEITTEHLDSAVEILTKIEQTRTNSDSSATKINNALTHVLGRKQEIEDAHDEIFGYTHVDDETQVETSIPGLKDELTESYSELKKDLASSKRDLQILKEERTKEYAEFHETKTEEFDALKKRIESLLPQAMTAGLSYAYEKKRKSEQIAGRIAFGTFILAIFILTAISVIPVAVSFYSFKTGLEFNKIVENLPKVVLAMLPLYAPALWFAITASKKTKLSKRLTEEYAHKEVLSKTFEGLSTQIAALGDGEESKDLRIKLLYNIVSASSDNPGKLISDYNNSDNPVMDALDKSISLGKSLEKLAAIPGVQKVLSHVERRTEMQKKKIAEEMSAPLDDAK